MRPFSSPSPRAAAIGAPVFSVVGYFDAKSHGGCRLAASLVPRMRK